MKIAAPTVAERIAIRGFDARIEALSELLRAGKRTLDARQFRRRYGCDRESGERHQGRDTSNYKEPLHLHRNLHHSELLPSILVLYIDNYRLSSFSA